MKPQYTLAIHVKRVKKLLEKDEPCSHCPVTPNFKIGLHITFCKKWSYEHPTGRPCNICKDFLGLSGRLSCPCTEVGRKEAVELAHKAVKKWEKDHR